MQLSVCFPSIHNGCYLSKHFWKDLTEGSWIGAQFYWTIGPVMATSILQHNYLQLFMCSFFLQQKNNIVSILITANPNSIPDWIFCLVQSNAQRSQRYIYTGGFTPFIHSDFMITESAFPPNPNPFSKYFHEHSHVTVTNMVAHSISKTKSCSCKNLWKKKKHRCTCLLVILSTKIIALIHLRYPW